MKIILGVFNAKVGRESIYRPTIGQFSLHVNTNENGLRLLDFAAGRNIVVSSISFRHRKIHTETGRYPHVVTYNQIENFLIDGRHRSSILDVRTFRVVTLGCHDHYLVAPKVTIRISRTQSVPLNTEKKA